MARIFFGVANPLRSSAYLLTAPPHYNVLSEQNTQTVSDLRCLDSTFEDIFSPVFEYYYDGPMGNYGANLKARHIGYHVVTSEGVRRVLELSALNIPMISSPDAFRCFVQNTVPMTRAIAIIEHNAVFVSDDEDKNSSEFYAVVYEKRADSDALFIYSSSAMTAMNTEDVGAYFRAKFFLFTPAQVRQSVEISDLYAIQDAKNLMTCLKVAIDEPMAPTAMHTQFSLDDRLLYNEKALMQAHMTTLVSAINALTVSMAP